MEGYTGEGWGVGRVAQGKHFYIKIGLPLYTRLGIAVEHLWD